MFTNDDLKDRPKHFKWLNIGVGLLSFAGIFGFFSISRIELFLALFCVVSMVAVAVLYFRSLRTMGSRLALNIARVVSVVLFLLVLILPWVMISFRHTKVMYPVRKELFLKGSQLSSSEDFFPDKLPEQCDEYDCFFRCNAIAPGQSMQAQLVFFTDPETLSYYEAKFRANSLFTECPAYIPVNSEFDENMVSSGYYFEEGDGYYYRVFNGADMVGDDLKYQYEELEKETDLVIFRIGNSQKQVVLDYSTGMAFFRR